MYHNTQFLYTQSTKKQKIKYKSNEKGLTRFQKFMAQTVLAIIFFYIYIRIKKVLQKADAEIENPKNLEEQAISLIGPDIYEKLVKGYTEKQWGRDCTDLPSFIIKRLPVRFTFDNNYFNDSYQGIPIGGYTKIIEKRKKNSFFICLKQSLHNKFIFTKFAIQKL